MEIFKSDFVYQTTLEGLLMFDTIYLVLVYFITDSLS